ncbi:uncharacterized protein LOC115626470 [Scaptodrosophila lebanonensis]|uniref:Uncharacterized protein LOC115626470 n=1 Tax=Drosophila lebanonensis TaxID=7225 RepID=A0A6J2TRH9_DROLE|nr:uncharacterized protein LOC115626470 [Scaptodrosophila lebanonensis]
MNGLHPDLENLQILNTGYSVDNLHRFTRLRKLRISADISADVLVECCKANPDLEIINLLGSTIYGKLADIVPYCNKLLDLSITLKANAVEYVHLAKLPHLKYLRLNGQHDIGSLQQVFRAFASNESQILKWLYVEPLINFDETKELIGIRSLSKLEYSYNDIRSLVALSQLNNLRTLQVKNTHSFPYQPVAGNEIIEAFLIILQRCRKLEVFFLHWYIKKHFISNVGELLKKVRDPETQLSLKLIGYENTKFITEKDKKMWKKLYGKYMRVILANRSNFEDKTESETPPSPPPADLYYG